MSHSPEVRPLTEPAPDVALARNTVEEHFPGLWPAVEAGLSTAATLRLEDNSNPAALIYVGDASTSKTTTADMFAGHPMCYRSDNFTPAAFVSHAANVSSDKLKEVDLLPPIRYRLLITPELAPIFRGKEDELTKSFSILTRVLDGEGLMTDSGTKGQRGYDGDYLFAWLGCTTPFGERVWSIMAQLGSRLFFWRMETGSLATEDDLVGSIRGDSYRHKLALCKRAVHQVLGRLLPTEKAVRGTRWDTDADPEPVVRRIVRCARLRGAQ